MLFIKFLASPRKNSITKHFPCGNTQPLVRKLKKKKKTISEFSGFLRSGNVFPPPKISEIFSGWNLELFEESYRLIGLLVRVFANGPGDLGSIRCRVIPMAFKMVFDISLLNTQQYKVRIKGKVEQPRESSSTLPYTSV